MSLFFTVGGIVNLFFVGLLTLLGPAFLARSGLGPGGISQAGLEELAWSAILTPPGLGFVFLMHNLANSWGSGVSNSGWIGSPGMNSPGWGPTEVLKTRFLEFRSMKVVVHSPVFRNHRGNAIWVILDVVRFMEDKDGMECTGPTSGSRPGLFSAIQYCMATLHRYQRSFSVISGVAKTRVSKGLVGVRLVGGNSRMVAAVWRRAWGGLLGLDNKSARTFVVPFICFTVKSYFENQSFHRNSCLSGTIFPLKSSIFGKEELSICISKRHELR
ncbi:hypothetical protein G2W53_002740 [Senna tora]|uniref:Uncharacterized protein n=1 Tax=Senna tora TaxID=362788 RepID=A0A834X9Y4_9FABA|nr:hypothetical protein G2W53_002740 [Senna tora]